MIAGGLFPLFVRHCLSGTCVALDDDCFQAGQSISTNGCVEIFEVPFVNLGYRSSETRGGALSIGSSSSVQIESCSFLDC
jgi:hypothetical protein